MAAASQIQTFPSAQPAVSVPAAIDWRAGLPVLHGSAISLRELRLDRCAGAAGRVRFGGSDAPDFAAAADARRV